MFASLERLGNFAAVLLLALAAGGCATSNTPGDPFEGFNRAMFSFNEGVDKAIIHPVATGYKAVVPEPARDCVSNVFSNINDIFVGVNSLLQGKVVDAASDACRIVVNTTVGLLGCFDVASKMGLDKHNRDFGQTFGKWGIGAGPYFVFPFLGPSNLREGVGTLIYTNLDPVWANHIPTRNVAYSLRALNYRAELLQAGNILEDAALDKYSFVRDAYRQRREGMINDDTNKATRASGPEAPLAQAVDVAQIAGGPAGIWFEEANQRGAQRVVLHKAAAARLPAADKSM